MEDDLPKVSQKEIEEKIFTKYTEQVETYLQDGPFVYELYGIMLHSGGAYGGHYSAYIKDYESAPVGHRDDCWYHFNDSYVKKIPITDVVNAFG